MELRYPKRTELICKRDWTLLNSVLVATNQVDAVKQHIGRGFSFSSIAYTNRACFMYFGEDDKEAFLEYMGERCVNDPAYVEDVCAKLRDIADRFKAFMRNDVVTPIRAREFLALHAEHHAYHIAMLWAGHFAAESGRLELASLRDVLLEARAHDERVLPDVDDWLTRHEDPINLLTPQEFLVYAEDGSLPAEDELNVRKEYSYFYASENGKVLLTGEDAAREHTRADEAVMQDMLHYRAGTLSGVGVSRGVARGIARVVEHFEDFRNVRDGEILVAPITLPKYNEFIRKAAGIVTNEGGMLNHAAILAREHRIPCVSGTKIATRVFHSGDHLEVDADMGTVRILP